MCDMQKIIKYLWSHSSPLPSSHILSLLIALCLSFTQKMIIKREEKKNIWLVLNLQQNQGSTFGHPKQTFCGSKTGSRWLSLTLHVGSYTRHKPINTYDTVATLLCHALNHYWTSLIRSSQLSSLLSTNKVTLRLHEAISCKLPRTVWKPSWNHVVLNCLLLAMFLESLPAAPQPLMAPWAHTAVSTLAKSQPPPAHEKLGRFSTTVEQMILAHITSNKKKPCWVSWMLCSCTRADPAVCCW